MNKKVTKIGLAVSLLFGVLSLTFSAAAEENGYWTMKTDESGTPVMIYTYTEPVNWVVNENAGYGKDDSQSGQPIAEVGQADVHYASNTPAAISGNKAAPVKKEPVNPFTVLLSAAGLFALSTLVVNSIKHRKRILVNIH